MLFKKHTPKDSVWTGFNKQCMTKHRAQQRLSKNPPLLPLGGAKDGEALYSQQKQDQELTVAQIISSLLPNSDLN